MRSIIQGYSLLVKSVFKETGPALKRGKPPDTEVPRADQDGTEQSDCHVRHLDDERLQVLVEEHEAFGQCGNALGVVCTDVPPPICADNLAVDLLQKDHLL